MIIQQIPATVLQYDADSSFLRAAWRQGCAMAEFRPALEQLTAFSQHHGIEQWLINIDYLPPLGTAEQAWILEEWFPSMRCTAVAHLALVLPPNLHNHIVAMTPVFNPLGDVSFELHFFTEDAAGFAWLLEQNPGRLVLWEEWQAEMRRQPHDAPDCAGSLAIH